MAKTGIGRLKEKLWKTPALPAPECLNPDGHVWSAWGPAQNVRRPGFGIPLLFWTRDRYDVYQFRTCRMCGTAQFHRVYSYKV